mmetsp:Transcript_78558/g.138429  ORF Transcript_78558/g.138429 Transcript_78558/m.138429 type:complete len:105 (+) Transcript_78558:1500-1814(+)
MRTGKGVVRPEFEFMLAEDEGRFVLGEVICGLCWVSSSTWVSSQIKMAAPCISIAAGGVGDGDGALIRDAAASFPSEAAAARKPVEAALRKISLLLADSGRSLC